jgi:integration host factor subunit beta
MTRSKLIQLLAEKQRFLSYRETEGVVKDIFEQMSDALGQGKRIEIRGFGSFSVRFRKPRLARNPKTGTKLQKEGKFAPYFRPGKELRERVNASAVEFPLLESTGEKDED